MRLDREGSRLCAGCGAPWSPDDLRTWTPDRPRRSLGPRGRFLAWGAAGVFFLLGYVLPWSPAFTAPLGLGAAVTFAAAGLLGSRKHLLGFLALVAIVPCAMLFVPIEGMMVVGVLTGGAPALFLLLPLFLLLVTIRGYFRHEGYLR